MDSWIGASNKTPETDSSNLGRRLSRRAKSSGYGAGKPSNQAPAVQSPIRMEWTPHSVPITGVAPTHVSVKRLTWSGSV